MSEIPVASEEPRRRPIWKDPFVLAFLVGITLVTLAAPRFRRIAPPPEVTGVLPAFRLADQSGVTVSNETIAGHVSLVGLVTVSQPDASRAVVAGLSQLQPRFGMARARVETLLIDLDGSDAATRQAWLQGLGPEAAGWRVLAGDGACALAAEAFAAPPAASACDRALGAAKDARLALVDAAGQVRGQHGSQATLYETFERTLRACDLASQ